MVNKRSSEKYLWIVAIPVIFLLFAFMYDNGVDEIVSWAIGDIDGDSKDELLVIRGLGEIEETGERYGNRLEIYREYALKDNEPIIASDAAYSFDLAILQPLKVQVGDINGDGLMEIAICVYKEAQFHPVMAKRPFFYDLEEGELIPIWLGSRLSRPFDDYILCDIDADDTEEIISIERQEDESCVIAAYNWKGFGFEVFALSDSFAGALAFEPALGTLPEEVIVKHTAEGVETMYKVIAENDKLICEER